MQLNGGVDNLFAAHLSTGSQPAAMNYTALTANFAAPVATNTTLTGEISGNGLGRKQSTYAHSAATGTGGTHNATLTTTYTVTGTLGSPVTVAKIGVFNAVSGGSMGYETQFTGGGSPLTNTGDSITVTHTITCVHT